MALSRKFLAGLGLEDRQVESILESHTETINGLKEERDTLREEVTALEGAKRELDALRSDTSLADLQKRFEDAEESHKKEVAKLKGDATSAQNRLAEAEKAHEEAIAAINAEHESALAELEAKVAEAEGKVTEANGERDAIRGEFDEYKAGVEAAETRRATESAYRTQVLKAAGIAPKYIDDVMAVTNIDSVTVGEDGSIENVEELVEAARTKWDSFVLRERTEAAEVDTPPETPKREIDGAHELAVEIAKQRHERMYGAQGH